MTITFLIYIKQKPSSPNLLQFSTSVEQKILKIQTYSHMLWNAENNLNTRALQLVSDISHTCYKYPLRF